MLDLDALAEMMAGLIGEHVEKAVAPLNARIAELEKRQPERGEKGEAGERGADGVSPDAEDIAAAFVPAAQELIAAEVAKAIAALPAPEKGPPGERGERGEAGERGADGRDGKDGADGRGVRDLLIDRDGQLVATMDDGEMKLLGPVCGRDGANGKDGRDGIDLTSFEAVVLEDDRTIELKFVSGDEERVASFKWPTVIYRGVYQAEREYEAGDAVTWGGSVWIAEQRTKAKPDTPGEGWKLAVKRGRDGKDARTATAS